MIRSQGLPVDRPRRPGLVDTGVALKVAGRFTTDPLQGSYLVQDLAESFDALSAEAEPLVAEEAGFGPSTPVRARVLSRQDWASANIFAAVDLLAPLLERFEAKIPKAPAGLLGSGLLKSGVLGSGVLGSGILGSGVLGEGGGVARKAYASFLGAQLGGVLGFVSQRVLGQYELDPHNAGDVWFVGPNIVMTERRFGFVPRDFRLWVAVHELTHRAQFEGNPWLRGYFKGLVGELLGSLELEPFSLLDRAIQAVKAPSGGDPTPMGVRMLDENQRRIFDQLQALMSVVEGHGNFIMDRVGAVVIPSQPRMRRTLSGGSMDGPLGKILRKVLGLDLKKLQYDEGQHFFDVVAEATGRSAAAAVFTSPGTLPTLEELREPARWLRRVGP